jgi:hypothetical protein
MQTLKNGLFKILESLLLIIFLLSGIGIAISIVSGFVMIITYFCKNAIVWNEIMNVITPVQDLKLGLCSIVIGVVSIIMFVIVYYFNYVYDKTITYSHEKSTTNN